jgi:hypothetical protein
VTVSSAVSKAVYDGNGATTVWPVPFEALDAGDVHVFLTNPDNETYEVDAGFTVDLDAGEVTYPSGGGAALPEGWRITLLRQMDLLQETDLINQGAFYAETVEEALDRLTMIAQQHAEAISRTVKVGVSETSMGVELTPDEVLHAADIAVAAASSAADAAAATASDALAALGAAEDAAGSAAAASAAESMAVQYGAIAFAASAPAWDAGETYNYPDVVAYTDGMSYRCKGVGVTGVAPPSDTDLWTAITVAGGSFFEIDDDGAYMPAAYPSYGDQLATPNIVPRVDGEGELGTLTKRWGRFNGRVLTSTPAVDAIPISRDDGTLHPGWFDMTTVMSLPEFEVLTRFPDGEPETFSLSGTPFACVRDAQGRLSEIHQGAKVYSLSFDDDGNVEGGSWA